MNYAESSYAGPDISGRTFAAHQFQHIAAWQDWKRRRKILARAEKGNRA